jgi:uncharacterized membrane protein
MKKLQRLVRHFLMTQWHAQRAFPARTLNAIEQAITTAESSHGGEIRFVMERELSTHHLLRNISPRVRAVQLFGELGVWDTEHNNGVLIYVSLADRDVEIVADRGYTNHVSNEEWTHVCSGMEQAFRRKEFERGSVEGIAAVSRLIERHYPAADGDELPNKPVIL